MWGEVLVIGAILSVALWLLARRGTGQPSPPAAGAEPTHRTWTAARPLDRAFPVERTAHEWRVGDAAFVDGFVLGHHLLPPRPARDGVHTDAEDGALADTDAGPVIDDLEVDERASPSDHAGPSAMDEDADDASFDAFVDASFGASFGTGIGLDDDIGSEDDVDADDGFDDGVDVDDGFDDDW